MISLHAKCALPGQLHHPVHAPGRVRSIAHHVAQHGNPVDPARGKTLCGYIHDRTDYLCKGILRKDERNPVSAGAYLSSGAAPLDRDDDTYATNNGGHATLTDESPGAQVAEVANLDLGIEDIRRAAGGREACR